MTNQVSSDAAATATATAATGSLWQNLAGRKHRSQMGGQLNESASAGVTSTFARKQLEKLGWTEGEGLGKRRQGMSSHIKVVKRAEGVGIGESNVDFAVQQSIGGEWWKNSVGDTLARLANKQDKKKKKKKNNHHNHKNENENENKTSDKKSSKKTKKKETTTRKMMYTDEELFAATGGARFGMRAQTQQHGKWKRTESGISEQDERDAKNKVEWDGVSAPVVLLTKSEKGSSSKSERKLNKRKLTTSDEDGDEQAKAVTEESTTSSIGVEDEKTERKRRKKEKKRKLKEATAETEAEDTKSKKKKRRKSKD